MSTTDDAPNQSPDLAVAVEQLRITLNKLPSDIGKAVRDAMNPPRPPSGPPLSWSQHASATGLDVLRDAGGSLLGHLLGRTDRTSAYGVARGIDLGRQFMSPGAGPSVPPPSMSRWSGQFFPPNPYATNAFGHAQSHARSSSARDTAADLGPVPSRHRTAHPIPGTSSTTGPNTPTSSRAISAPGVIYNPPPGVSFPNAPGALGAQARAGWQTAGVQLAKGLASVSSPARAALGLASFGLGMGLRAIEAGSDLSDLVHYRNAGRVAPFSAIVSREMALTAASDIHRDVAFAHATEATAAMAESSRRRFRESTLPIDSRLGNATNAFAAFSDSFLATNVEAFNRNGLPVVDKLGGLISTLNDKATGVDGIAGTGADARSWGQAVAQVALPAIAGVAGFAVGGVVGAGLAAWGAHEFIKPDPNAKPDTSKDFQANMFLTNFATQSPQPINQVKGIGLVKIR